MNRFIITSSLIISIVILTFITLFPKDSDAIPAFARKYKFDCSSCHTAWPQLNKFGRDFKERGYKLPTDEGMQVISDFQQWDKVFPVTAVLVSRPYDEKKSGDRKIRALHEVELMVAGVLYKTVSGFLEIEAEDEEDFDPEIPIGVFGYHPFKALNIQLSWSPLLWADPYDSYSHNRRLTRGSYSVIDQKFGGADNDGKLRDSRQTIAVYGRTLDMLFYSIGFSGVADDSEGENAHNLHARLAVDVLPEATIGAFGMSGRWEMDSIARDFNRIGFDLQADFYNARVTGAYLLAEDELDTTEEDNDAWYAQAFYVFKKGTRPLVVPLIRYDSYEENDGKDQFDELTLNLSFYFTQNIKGFVEYWTQTDVPSGVTKDKRFTVQLAAAF